MLFITLLIKVFINITDPPVYTRIIKDAGIPLRKVPLKPRASNEKFSAMPDPIDDDFKVNLRRHNFSISAQKLDSEKLSLLAEHKSSISLFLGQGVDSPRLCEVQDLLISIDATGCETMPRITRFLKINIDGRFENTNKNICNNF
ncbi:unnamed protein product [Gordionus sp. m RMFG-2023]